MKEILWLFWAILAFTTLWWLSAKSLFPWVDEKRAQRVPLKNQVPLDDILKEK